ncbi:hypothetical protein D3C71_1820380 [compost metagenome]
MHHGLNVGAQLPGKFRVTQVALNKLGATPHQMLHTLGPATVDPHVQALLQGETRKAPADEAARAGDQNLHVLLQMQLQASSFKLQVKNGLQALHLRLAA